MVLKWTKYKKIKFALDKIKEKCKIRCVRLRKSLSLLLLDKDLDVVHDISLMDLLQPDFGMLTAPIAEVEATPVKQDAHSLVKIRAGLKNKNTNEPERKIEISTKQEEGMKQA